MKAYSLILVLLAVAQWCAAYSAYQQRGEGGYSSSYTSSSSQSSSSATGSAAAYTQNCCQLNSWAYDHMAEIRQFANSLREEFNNLSQGRRSSHPTVHANTQWNVNIIGLTGKTSLELSELSRSVSQQLVSDMDNGLVAYNTIAQPNFFEWKAAQTLETHANSGSEFGQQQQILDIGHNMPVDISNYDEVKNYAYPAEVKVIDGKTYLVHKNCTEATKTTGDGTYGNPLVTVVNRNRTTIATNSRPGYTVGVYGGGSSGGTSSSLLSGSTSYPGAYVHPSSSTTVTRKKTVYDWVNQHMEPSVVDYKPVINIGSDWSSNLDTYQPPVHIPVDTSRDVETFSTGSQMFRPTLNPGSTVTVRRYNKTIITNSDGTNTVHGSEVNKKWVDGKLVYDTERPFGEWTVPRDEAWKHEERELFFWFLTFGAATQQNLEMWQRQQEERLLGLAERYHTTIEEIQAWHRKELERYRVLLGQYQAQNNDVTSWKRMERGRLDWLIHQNSVTRVELERWQRENKDRLAQLARQYKISLEELKNWQIEELERLYVYFNDQNNSMISRPDSGSLQISEQERMEELIRQHNATIAQLHNSIKLDQQKLVDLQQKYKGNVQDMEKWLKDELARLSGVITQQRDEMTRITEWQRSERQRLEDLVKMHRGSVSDLESQMARDRTYIQSLASKYHVSIEELEKWQRAEVERLQSESQNQLQLNIKEWQRRERDHLKSIIQKNDLTIEEFQTKIISDRARLENLANTYKIQVSEVEDWIKSEIKNFQSQGLLKEVEKELALWQQKERDRLLAIVQQNELTVEELENKIKNDQTHLYALANTYQVRVEEIEEWLKKELVRLQGEGLIKVEDLQDWQKNERSEILKIVQQNKLTIEEFEKRLLADRSRLQDLSKTYNVQTTEIESWIKKEGERLQSLGLLQMQEQLNNWQKIERERLLALVNQNNLSIEELEERIKKDQVHLYSMAHQHQVRVEEIEEWIKKEIKKLQQEGLIEMGKLKDWQTEWRGNLTNMVKERDFTVEEFHKWLLEDRARLQTVAMQHNVQIEEIEQWIQNEEQRFVSMGLLRPNERLTNWQEIERRYLERITQDQYHSTEQLEQRLRQDRELLEKLARDYSVQVEEIERWMKKELTRLRDDGQLQIDNLTAWQISERERLEALIKENKQWSAEEFEALLRKDREHMQTMAFQYHTSVEEIEKWIQSEVARLQRQGKLNIEELTVWQKAEQQRLLNLLHQQSSITVEEFEQKVQQDRTFLMNLANQYHVSVVEVEEYVKKVIDDLRVKGKFEVENLQNWQIVERDYIKQLIAQYNNGLSTTEYEQKLLADRAHLRQLSDQYRININQIEKWMVEELKRLRKGSENQVQQLTAWQITESQRLKDLIKQNNHLSYVEYEVELMKERARLQELANQYALSVEQIEQWLRQQLLNLKVTGEVQVESLTQWQEVEQKRLIDMLLQQQKTISYEDFNQQLLRDRARLQQLATQYSVSVERIEQWMRDELQRLKNSGLLQVEELTYWQKIERDRLEDWLKKQNNGATFEQFIAFLQRDQNRLQRIAQDYHITVEEVESWVQQEGARLQILGLVQRPEKVIYWDTWTTNNNFNVHDNSNDNMWKTQTRAHLQAIAQVKPMSWQEFEQYLTKERMRWEQFARQYNITVEEIEVWLRQSAQELQQQGLIHGTVTVEEWEANEQMHIQNLINEKLRKQQLWSIEELERQLLQDRDYMQRLARQYQVTIEKIEAWYKQELQRLLDSRKIISENLVDWQRLEKQRIYQIVLRQPGVSLQWLEQQLLQDKSTLNRLADEYHVSIEELEYFIRGELRRLLNLGLLQDTSINNLSSTWRQQEKERLRTIAAEIIITEEEFLEYIAGDHAFQQQLTQLYGCALEQLAPFQRTEISAMQREGLFDNTQLLKLQDWQKKERDRLYLSIKTQNLTLKYLKNWQRQEFFLTEMAAKYGITVQNLKDWQLQEYNRLVQLAKFYQIDLKQLEAFRDDELRYITYVMHKKTSSEDERINWASNEARRIESLERRTGMSGEKLLAWRRRLYLLSQGLIPLDYGGSGGYDTGVGSTNRTGIPEHIISKDRGDQPPNVFEENIDSVEPGLDGEHSLYPPPPAQINMPPSTPRPMPYLPPTRSSGVTLPAGGGGVQSGYRYSKKEYKFTVPVGVASASANAGASGTSASASVGHGGYGHTFNGMESHSLTMAGENQQQQQDVEDFGQQQQVDLGWNSDLQDGGQQQQVQLEDFSSNSSSASATSHGSTGDNGAQGHRHGHRHGHGHGHGHRHQQQQQVENFGQQQNLGQLNAQDGGQQQVEDVSSYSSSASATSGHRHGHRQDRGHGHHQQQQQVEDFGQQQQVDLAWNGQLNTQDGGQQQVEDLSSYSSSASATAHGEHGHRHGNRHGHGHGQQEYSQQQVEDFGQQRQVELADFKQQESDQQQQVQVEDLTGTFTTSQHGASGKQVAAEDTSANAELEVKAEAEPAGFWGKLKKKTTNIFG